MPKLGPFEIDRKSEPFDVYNDVGSPHPFAAKPLILAALNCGINDGSSFCGAHLVDAVAVLVNELGFHRFRVTVVGAPARPEDDEYLESLKKSSRQAGVDEYIRWVGSIPHRDVVPYLQRSHALVRMLGDGGFGKHELEALSCGVPALVCTPVYRDVYGEFAASLCWQEKDASDRADKIRATASWSENDRERFSSLARSYVESHHNLNNLVRKIVDEFQSGALS